MNDSPRKNLLWSLVAFLAGFSFLVYEVSWFRLLSLALGATVTASTVVLAAFMGGLGFGARWFGGCATRLQPSRILAGLFGVLGLMGLLSHPVIVRGVPALYAWLGATAFSVSAAGRVALGLSLVGLLVPACLMGGFLPLAARLFVRDDRRLAEHTGLLYAAETFGSALGALAAAFLLIRWLGQAQTIYLAASLNFLLAAGFLYPAWGNEPLLPPEDKGAARRPLRPQQARIGRVALTVTFVFGLAVAGLQIAWIRIFRVYLANTSYAFALIAAAAILGLAAGSRLYAARSGGETRKLSKLLFFAAVAVFAGWVVLLYLPDIVMFPLAGGDSSVFMRIIGIPVVASLLVVLPVALLSGYAFPLACTLHAGNPGRLPASLGAIYAANAAGAVLGPPVVAFILIPWKGAALAVAALAAFFAAAFAFLSWRPLPAAATAFVLGACIALAPVLPILPPSFARSDRELILYRETVEGTWLVARGSDPRDKAVSAYVNNSAVIGSTYDAIKAVKLVGHLPFLAGLRCRDALVVGFGIGVTTGAIAAHPEVERIDCVELVAGLTEAASFYSALNRNVHQDSRLTVHAGDGRHFLQATARRYDLISSDPTHPVLGSGSLYTREYFALCRSRLNEGGMVSQYLPLHKLRLLDLQSIIRGFREVFPGATVWLGHSHAILLGRKNPARIDFDAWSSRAAALAPDNFFYSDPWHLAACLLLDDETIAAFPPDTPGNTDDRPLTEFFSLDALDEGNVATNLAWLNERRIPPHRLFTRIPDPLRLTRFAAGNRIMTEGIVLDLRGDRAGFRRKLAEAAAANAENQEYPFLERYFR